MPAYIIVEIEILDPVGYEEYKKLAGASVEITKVKVINVGGPKEFTDAIESQRAKIAATVTAINFKPEF